MDRRTRKPPPAGPDSTTLVDERRDRGPEATTRLSRLPTTDIPEDQPPAGYYEIVYLDPQHLKMAEIYQKLGDAEKAVENYTRFAELWKDCDPELWHLVDETEARIALLREGVR
jgi:hypothetical protein